MKTKGRIQEDLKEGQRAQRHNWLMEYMPWCERIYAEIDLDAVRSNLEHIREHLSKTTTIIAVVKTDGYGHGAVPIARELDQVSYLSGFAVATFEEALALRQAGVVKPVLVLGYTFPYCYEEMVRREIRMTVFREDTLLEIAKTVKSLHEKGVCKKAKVHIKVDTGMGRIGINPKKEGIAFVKKAFHMQEMEVEGIFTHLARADETDKTAALRQVEVFKDFLKEIKESCGREIPIKHCANSAGGIELPETDMDAVRAGIILYGLWPSEQVNKEIVPLLPAMSLYSHIIYVKEVEAGSQISYGGTFTAKKKMRIATIPAGYGDGYPRGLSGKGYVLLHGKRAPVLGRVCMDQFMVDVTDIPEASEGDLVTLIGRDGEEQITMEQAGALSGRFNYEFACAIGKRVPRVYVKDGKILPDGDGVQDF